MTPPLRCAIYARVSTVNHGQDPELQLRELREYAQARGLVVHREYVDRGQSGSKDSRPELNQLMKDARRRRFDAVAVWKLDRFSRSLRALVNSLAEFESLGIGFIALRDHLDLTTPTGRLLFQVVGAMAEFEKAILQERVIAGLRNARLKGRTLGRPKRKVDLSQVKSLRDSGASWRQVAREMKIGLGTLFRAVESSATDHAA